jgi:drug/metabolite transporter (DMT)-like permease
MIWIPITVAAASLQVARNATQRSLMGGAGPWGATLVRFLFGLPFSLLFVSVAVALSPGTALHPSLRFFLLCAVGGVSQITATAALLVCMQRSSFAIGSSLQQSLLPFTAIMGQFLFGDALSPAGWLGVAAVSVGVFGLSWPRDGFRGDWSAAVFGLAAGFAFAIGNNVFRHATLTLDAAHLVAAAVATVCVVQAIQSVILVIALALLNRPALIAALRSWRPSLGAGFFGAAASACWFTALAMAPAGPVRAVGVVEIPIAALTGRRMFAEKLTVLQIAAAAVTAVGVVLAALA